MHRCVRFVFNHILHWREVYQLGAFFAQIFRARNWFSKLYWLNCMLPFLLEACGWSSQVPGRWWGQWCRRTLLSRRARGHWAACIALHTLSPRPTSQNPRPPVLLPHHTCPRSTKRSPASPRRTSQHAATFGDLVCAHSDICTLQINYSANKLHVFHHYCLIYTVLVFD